VAALTVGDLVLNQAGRELQLDGQPKELTSTEFSILQLLLQRSGEVVEKKVAWTDRVVLPLKPESSA